ncbi:unnamed protein product [Lathyrus oleraceus]
MELNVQIYLPVICRLLFKLERVSKCIGQCVGGCSIAMCSVKGVPTGGVLSFCRVMVLTERLRLSVFCCLSCCRLKGSEVEKHYP